jgi:hypothetical protein
MTDTTTTPINPAKLYRAVNISSHRGTCILCDEELVPGGRASVARYAELRGEAAAFFLTGRRDSQGNVDLRAEAQVEPKEAQRERRPDGCTCKSKQGHMAERTAKSGRVLPACGLWVACACPEEDGRYGTYIKHRARCANKIKRAELWETRPGFWDSFVHADCAVERGFVTPAKARYTRGRRWEGLLDNGRVAGSSEQEAGVREDTLNPTPAQESAIERGKRLLAEEDARRLAERLAQADRDREALEAAQVERFRQLAELENRMEEEPAPAPEEGPDPSVERFRRLDLD